MKGIADTGFRVASSLRDSNELSAFDCDQPADWSRECRPHLADLCLIRMSELYPRHSVITVDYEDFRIYRRNKRESIPLIYPPRP